jgi:hypothetical protein
MVLILAHNMVDSHLLASLILVACRAEWVHFDWEKCNLIFWYCWLCDLRTKCLLGVTHRSCEALKPCLPWCNKKSLKSPLQSLNGPSDYMEHTGIEMHMVSIPTYHAPSRMMVDCGESRRQRTHNKNLWQSNLFPLSTVDCILFCCGLSDCWFIDSLHRAFTRCYHTSN